MLSLSKVAGDVIFSTKVEVPERQSSWPPETAVPVLKLDYQRTKKSSWPPETAVPVLKLYCKRLPLKKIQLAAGDGCSTIEVVLPENENPAHRRRLPFQYYSCNTREWPKTSGHKGTNTITKTITFGSRRPVVRHEAK